MSRFVYIVVDGLTILIEQIDDRIGAVVLWIDFDFTKEFDPHAAVLSVLNQLSIKYLVEYFIQKVKHIFDLLTAKPAPQCKHFNQMDRFGYFVLEYWHEIK